MIHLDKIVDHLLVEQKVNVLDKTKCSTSARHIYNYLCSDWNNSIYHNDNLSRTDPNIDELIDKLQAKESTVYYVHLDHLTNETSHYFIIVQIGEKVIVLQSAVFEFSIYEWLYPEESLEREKDVIQTHRLSLNESGDIRDKIALEYSELQSKQIEQILQSIINNKFSNKVEIGVDTFIDTFVHKLKKLEGMWTLDDPISNLE
jgi:hypothetical protein